MKLSGRLEEDEGSCREISVVVSKAPTNRRIRAITTKHAGLKGALIRGPHKGGNSPSGGSIHNKTSIFTFSCKVCRRAWLTGGSMPKGAQGFLPRIGTAAEMHVLVTAAMQSFKRAQTRLPKTPCGREASYLDAKGSLRDNTGRESWLPECLTTAWSPRCP